MATQPFSSTVCTQTTGITLQGKTRNKSCRIALYNRVIRDCQGLKPVVKKRQPL